jgi:putative ABC transport system permease protein
MSSPRRAIGRLRAFFSKRYLDNDLEAELAAHINLAIDENIERGMTPDQARRQAMLEFGGVQQARERQREARGLMHLDIFFQDLKYTLRTLARDPGFTAVAVLILALGMGANIAVFSVVDTLMLRPLPFHDSNQLVWIAGNKGTGALSDTTFRVDSYEAIQRNNRSFQQITGYVPFFSVSEARMKGQGQPQQLTGVWVEGNFFRVLGIQPALGRLFTPDETVKGGRPVVLLSHSFWQRQFASNPKIIGQAITLNDVAVTVVGVLPASFDFGAAFHPGMNAEIFSPAINDRFRRWGHMLSIIAVLRLGVTAADAQNEMNAEFTPLIATHPEWLTDFSLKVSSLKDHISGKLRRSLVVLWCAVGLILLIVSVNLSNLLLARAAARSKELAMRRALGAGRLRLIRQLVTESLVLSFAGAAFGLAFAYTITVFLAHQSSIALPLLSSVRVDTSALEWTLLISVCAATAFGIVPALSISSGNLRDLLQGTSHGATSGAKQDRLRSTLVISEVALACVLLIGAGLLLRSFLRVLEVDLGFEPFHAAAMQLNIDDGGSFARRTVLLQEKLRRILAIPGIEAAGISDKLPLDRNRSWDLAAKGRSYPADANHDAYVYIVTPGYFQAMGMHLREGRDFTWDDKPDTEKVIVINQAAARRDWPGEDPIGRLALGIGDVDSRVVGVISDVHDSGVEDSPNPEVFVPITQGEPEGGQLVVRSSLPPAALASPVMRSLRDLNPNQSAAEFRPIQTLVDHSTSPRRFFMLLVGAFATLGLILAALGIYSVISYTVTRQTQEIGIRMALGASASRVQFDVLAKTVRLAAIGLVLGVSASFLVARAIAALLFNVAPDDMLSFFSALFLLTCVAVLAGYLPARRASRIDPVVALRGN